MSEHERVSLDHLGLGSVSLIHGDLAAESADVLVCEANDRMVMTGGVAGALRARGGVAIHKEAISLAPVPLGRVVRTGVGGLDAQFVYHAVTKDFELNRGLSGRVVATVVTRCIEMAAQDGARSICFPLFGEGGGSDLFGLAVPVNALIEGLEAGGLESGDGPEVRIFVRDVDEFVEARGILQEVSAGAARRDEESKLAEDFMAQLLGDMGDVGDLDFG